MPTWVLSKLGFVFFLRPPKKYGTLLTRHQNGPLLQDPKEAPPLNPYSALEGTLINTEKSLFQHFGVHYTLNPKLNLNPKRKHRKKGALGYGTVPGSSGGDDRSRRVQGTARSRREKPL